ncbi:MAG: phosphoglycerate dehydrogenase [Pseudomonadota bacterium]
MSRQFSRPNKDLRVVLLEGIHPTAGQTLEAAGFERIEPHSKALEGDALRDAVAGAHYLGIRSRTRISDDLLANLPELRAIGCFCIGVNQVELAAARARGVPVFNAPFSNTRSVAELVIAEAILLLRDVPRKNALAHRGVWRKSASGAHEVRGKRIGIVGYGHIGSQVGVLAEALGMQVFFFDVETKLALGNASQVGSINRLLGDVDVVTLHVPESESTREMIDATAIDGMRDGAVLINASRGSVVNIDALAAAIKQGKLAGAAVDVFPEEPESNEATFASPLCALDNVLLTPHVGGSTEEAQASIGVEVAEKLIRYNDNGSTVTAVNFPQVSLPPHLGTYRLLHIHRNQPGVLAAVNAVFSGRGINIQGESLQTDPQVGYVVVDFDMAQTFDVEQLERLKQIDGTLRARILTR